MKYVVYDTETSGVDTAHDQILQFAACVFDNDFNEVEAVNLRCRRAAHILPHPKALAVTGIEPATLDDTSLPLPYDFACGIHRRLEEWSPACFLGYNILSFDEEMLRSMFWQNLLPPYLTSMNGCHRIDLYPIVQAVAAMAPDVLVIPVDEDGKPSYRLERLAPANGYGAFEAHDALADVRATAFIAKLISTQAPELWSLLTGLAHVKTVMSALHRPMTKLFTHFGKPEWRMITRIASNPGNHKQVACFDLGYDPAPYLALSAEELAEKFATDYKVLRIVKANGQPVLTAPAEGGDLTGLDDMPAPTEAELEARLALIKADTGFEERMKKALALRQENFEGKPWLENRIYDGFPSREDENLARRYRHAKSWRARIAMSKDFKDERFRQLAMRIVCLNAPHELFPSKRKSEMEPLIRGRLFSNSPDVPWTTFSAARAGLADIEGHPMAANIATWLDETERKVERMLAA